MVERDERRGEDEGEVAEARSKFLASVLRGAFETAEEIERAARDCDSTLEAPCGLVAFVAAGDGTRDLRERVLRLRPALAGGLVSPILTDPRTHSVAVVPLRGRPWNDVMTAVGERLEDTGLVALAEPAASLADLADVYAGIRDRVTVMGRFRARARVLRALDLTLVWAASQAKGKARFLDVDAVLGLVLARRRDWAGRDMATLTALRDHGGDIVAVARHLGIEVAEVRRKLRGIQDRTGLDLDNPVDVAKLGWALSLYWADPDSLPNLGDRAWGRAAQANETVRGTRAE